MTALTSQPKQTFAQSNFKFKRGFKSWLREYKNLCAILQLMNGLEDLYYKLDDETALMYYNGGYSPKMVWYEINRIPHNVIII